MFFRSRSLNVSVTCALTILIHSASASEWAVDADGYWNLAGSWLGPIPDSSGATAFFGSAITSNRTVLLTDPTDDNVTASQLMFDGHFGYLVEPQLGQMLTLAGNPTASLLMPGRIGNARHTIDDSTVLSGVLIALPQNFTLRNESSGVFSISAPGGGSNVVLTKTGPGGAKVAMGSFQYAGSTRIVVNEGTFSGYLSFADNVVLDGGHFLVDRNSPNTKSITIGPAGGTIELYANLGPGGGGWIISTPNYLSGNGLLTKEGLGRMRLGAAQTAFTGAVAVRGGQLDASDSSQPLANATQFHIAGASGIFAGQLHLSSTNLSGVPVSIGEGGILVAPSGAGVGLSSLTRGGNLTAAPGAVIAQTMAGGNESIQGLGPTQDLFFGIGATQNITALTVGAGTPWQGISGIANVPTTLNSTGSGTITANSDFTIQHYDQLFKLNNTSIATSGDRHAVIISAPTAGSMSQGVANRVLPAGLSTVGEGFTIMGTASFEGVSRFVVTNGATFNVVSAGVFGTGSTQAPVLEVQSGATFVKTAVTNPTVPDSLGLGTAAATILIRGPSWVTINKPNDASLATGGKFVIEARLPATLSVTASANNLGADSLTFSIPGAALNLSGTISGPTSFDTTATMNTSSIATLNGGLIGSGVFTKGSSGRLIVDGSKSHFTGLGSQLRIESGSVELFNGGLDAGPNGPSIFIGQSTRLQSAGVFSFPNDVDEGAKLATDTVGILAIHGTNSSLSGVNHSFAFIGADGTQNLTTSSLAPGKGNIYRLGGGLNTPVLNVTGWNVLTGANDLVIGMPASRLGKVLTNGSGTVILQNSNSYTGSTRINTQSTLAIEAARGIGNGPAPAGPIDLEGTMELRSAGTIGTSGTITLKYGGLLQIDDTGVVNGDRIPNSTPIQMRGGTIRYFSNNPTTTPSSETIGQPGSGVALLDGVSKLDLPKTFAAPTTLATTKLHDNLVRP